MSEEDLYTGMTGANETFGNEQPSESTQKEIDKQKTEREELKMNAKYITEVVRAERENVSQFRSYLVKLPKNVKAEDIQAEFRARELYLDFLDTLESQIKIKLQEVKK